MPRYDACYLLLNRGTGKRCSYHSLANCRMEAKPQQRLLIRLPFSQFSNIYQRGSFCDSHQGRMRVTVELKWSWVGWGSSAIEAEQFHELIGNEINKPLNDQLVMEQPLIWHESALKKCRHCLTLRTPSCTPFIVSSQDLMLYKVHRFDSTQDTLIAFHLICQNHCPITCCLLWTSLVRLMV